MPLVYVEEEIRENAKIIDEWPAYHISDFLSERNKLPDITWVIFSKYDVNLSPYYLKDVLSHFDATKTVVGRFGCLPTETVPQTQKFSTCKPYPILQSAFAMSADLFDKIPNDFQITEQNIVKSDTLFKYIDDFRFHYFPADHSTRGNDFAISYYPQNSSNLLPIYSHVSGMNFSFMVSPKIRINSKHGISPNSSIKGVSLHYYCSNQSLLQSIPMTYHNNITIPINCFKS